MAAETEPQTVLAESATVNYAVYQVLENNPALTCLLYTSRCV